MLAERLRLRDIRNTSTFRLTLLFGVIFAIGIAVLLGLIYGLSARELTHRSDRILRLEAAMLEASPPGMLPDRVRIAIARSAGGLNYFELRSGSGARVAGNIQVSEDLPLGRPVEMAPGHGVNVPIRLLAVRAPSRDTLFVGRDITPVRDLRSRVVAILVGSGLATAIAVFFSGIMLSLPPLRRVRDMQRASRSIAAGDLDMRMPLMGRGDELDLFAGTVNTMVEEVGRVIGQVKGVTDAIAHDLRTPLTRVRSQLYRVRQSDDVRSPTAAMIEAATTDLDAVLERFAALLRISELEAGGRRAGFDTVDLGRLVAGIHDLYEPLADERGIALVVDRTRHATVHGDDKLLFEAVSNLVDNAIKFTPPGGQVSIAILDGRPGDGGAGVTIEVRDDGPGLAEGERQAVLRRFHQGAAAADIPGSGLGLSVVSAIMHLHGFTLAFADGRPGLIARLCCHENRVGAVAQ